MLTLRVSRGRLIRVSRRAIFLFRGLLPRTMFRLALLRDCLRVEQSSKTRRRAPWYSQAVCIPGTVSTYILSWRSRSPFWKRATGEPQWFLNYVTPVCLTKQCLRVMPIWDINWPIFSSEICFHLSSSAYVYWNLTQSIMPSIIKPLTISIFTYIKS